MCFRDNLKIYRDVMTCSTNTYFHSLEQSLKEYIDYELIKNILHVSLIFIFYFTKTNYPSSQMITQALIFFKPITTLFRYGSPVQNKRLKGNLNLLKNQNLIQNP